MEYHLKRIYILFIFGLACCHLSQPGKDFYKADIKSISVHTTYDKFSIKHMELDKKRRFEEAILSRLTDKGYQAWFGSRAQKEYNLATSFLKEVQPTPEADAIMIFRISSSYAKDYDRDKGKFFPTGKIAGTTMHYWLYERISGKRILWSIPQEANRKSTSIGSYQHKGREIMQFQFTESEGAFIIRAVTSALDNLPPI